MATNLLLIPAFLVEDAYQFVNDITRFENVTDFLDSLPYAIILL